MAGTFPIGGIPAFDAWEGQELTFSVSPGLRDARFTIEARPAVSGTLAVDGTTGLVTFVAGPQDREAFTAVLRATAGDASEGQDVSITPHPTLPPEFRCVEHRAATVPDVESDLYLTWAERPDPQPRVFNNTADFPAGAEPAIRTRVVTVSAVRLVLEAGSARHKTFARLHDMPDIRVLTVCADEVVVRSALHVPGAEVHIHARVLRFDDTGGQTASITTTPRSVGVPADKRDKALAGQAGGAVFLHVQRLEETSRGGDAVALPRIDTRGGAGQPGRPGEAGVNGTKLIEWDYAAETFTSLFTTNRVSWERFRYWLDGHIPVYVESEGKESWLGGGIWAHKQTHHTKEWPTDGGAPKRLPGPPGHGGDGGPVTVVGPGDLPDSITGSGFVRADAGQPGRKASDVAAASPGTPVKACWVRAEWNRNYFEKNDARNLLFLRGADGKEAKHVALPGPAGPAPDVDPALPAGKAGAVTVTAGSTPAYWVHPAAVRAVVAYTRDTMLAGHPGAGRAVLEPYLAALAGSQATLELAALAGEVTGLAQSIDGPFDYFGNPAGWAPFLSFETNLALYRNEVASAIPTLFLAYWIEQKSTSGENSAMTMVAAIERMDQQSATATKEYTTALTELGRLAAESRNLVADMASFGTQVKEIEKEERRNVANDAKLEYVLRGTANVLGGIMQLVPVGQPALGAFGKGFTVLSTIDKDNPADSLGSLAGAFAPMAQDLLTPKAKAFAAAVFTDPEKPAAAPPRPELPKKDSEAEDFRKKFDEGVAKKNLEAKVKTHLDEMKAAKDQITGAVAKFSAPESVIKERLAKVLAERPAYKVLERSIEELNERKAKVAAAVLAATAKLDAAATTIVTNQVAALTLCGELGDTLGLLSHDGAQHARGMGQQARARLVKYQYYLLKSYHYHMLADHPRFDFTVTALFDKFAEMLVDSRDGTLTQDKYAALGAVFEGQLRDLVEPIVEHYQTRPMNLVWHRAVTLSPAQLAVLNEPAGRVTIDLMAMGYLNLGQEDDRIKDVVVTHAALAGPPPTSAVNVDLTIRHSGRSRLRKDGRLYLFRSGGHLTDDGSYADTHMCWGATVQHVALGPKLVLSRPDPAGQSLLRHLLGDKSGDAGAAVLNYHPAVWDELVVERVVSGEPTAAAGKLTALELDVQVSAASLNREYSTVSVRVGDGVRPLIRCSETDLNERSDGEGGFLRTFDRRRTPQVTLTAPAAFGRREFLGWRIAEAAGATGEGAVAPARLGPARTRPPAVREERVWIPTRTLRLDLRARSTYAVEPVYGPVPAPLAGSPVFDPHNHFGGILPYRVLALHAGPTGLGLPSGHDVLDRLLAHRELRSMLTREIGWVPDAAQVEDYLAHREVLAPDGRLLKIQPPAERDRPETVWARPEAYAANAVLAVVRSEALARVELVLLGRFFHIVVRMLESAQATGTWADRAERLAAGSGVLPHAIAAMVAQRPAVDWSAWLDAPTAAPLVLAKPIKHLLQHVLTATPLTAYDTAYVVRGYLNQDKLHDGVAALTLPQVGPVAVRELARQGVTYTEVSAGLDDIRALARDTGFAESLKRAGVRIGWLAQVANSRVMTAEPAAFGTATGALAKALKAREVVGFSLLAPETDDYDTPEFRANLRHLLDLCAAEPGARTVAHIHVGEGAPSWALDPAQVTALLTGKRADIPPQLADGAFAREAEIARRNIDTVLAVVEGWPRPDHVRIRLGHVTHVTAAQAATMKRLGLWADVNLTSNVVTGAWVADGEPYAVDLKRLAPDDVAGHGVHAMAQAGVPFVLGTDGGGVEHSAMPVELAFLARIAALTDPPAPWPADARRNAAEHLKWMG